ncbi:hypothetical protein KFK09_010838 [Dendrobium nobile]|uniref:F-box domain-containing protein n=1 Tax=Dendrobium nobile TaxID=94219 RepID=A0A8T3BD72_DENNO|nr:hypothetical protein KFK09_010838 [Dendrobium nobile]
MEGGGGSCAPCSNIQWLPEECVTHVISLTSPRDACRLEAVSADFQSAASSDKVWRSFLPSDYAEILARAVDRVEFGSMKHLYFRLCDPILIDGGRMRPGLSASSCRRGSLGMYTQGESPQCWRWIHHPESRFSDVAELLGVYTLGIKGKINSRMLSKWTRYSAYLVFKLSNHARGLSHPLQEVFVTVGAHCSWASLLEDLQDPLNDQAIEAPNVPDEPEDQAQRDHGMVGKPQTRQDGWMEILLGEFFNEEGDDGVVTMILSEMRGGSDKSGLIVQGIEIRPTKKENILGS